METKVVIELKNEDMAALYRYIVTQETIPIKQSLRTGTVFMGIFIVVLILLNLNDLQEIKSSALIFVGLAVFFAIMLVLPTLLHKITGGINERMIMRQSPSKLQIEGTKQYTVSQSGIKVSTVYGDANIKPSEVEDFRCDGKYVFIKASKGKGAHVIPLKYFANEAAKEKFLDSLAALAVSEEK